MCFPTEMRGNLQPAPVSTLYYEDMEVPDQDLPMDLQEAFGFLDLMDSCASNQVCFYLCHDIMSTDR